MACNCGGGGSNQRNIEYEVKLKNGEVKRYSTTAEAQQAIRASGGGTFRPVKALASA